MATDISTSTISNRYYTDEKVLAKERDAVFAKGWVSVGLAATLRPGSARPAQVAGVPILLTRTRDGALHVFHNICRHRGLVLVDEPCDGQRRLTCPYHDWSYKLSGALQGAPYYSGKPGTQVPEDRARTLGLVPVRHHVWFDIVFVNLSEDAPPFDDWVAPLARTWSAFDASRLHLLSSTDYSIAANWKLVCENFVDGYHVPFVHRQAGGPETAVNFENLDLSDDIFGFILPKGEADKKKPEWLARLNLPAELQDAQFFFCLFPNTLVAITAGWFQVLSMQPEAADRSSEFLALYLMEEPSNADPAETDKFSAFMNRINQQDVDLLPKLQEGRRSPGAEENALAPYWDEAVHRFHSRVRAAIPNLPDQEKDEPTSDA